jgi:hypothetical protein
MREFINIYTIDAATGFVKRNRELHERSKQSCWRNVEKRPWEIGAEGIVGAAGSGVFVATGRIVVECPELQFW